MRVHASSKPNILILKQLCQKIPKGKNYSQQSMINAMSKNAGQISTNKRPGEKNLTLRIKPTLLKEYFIQ
jgi:hypothetical protein